MTQTTDTTHRSGISGTTSHLIAQTARAHVKRAAALLSEIDLHLGQEFLLEALWTEGSLNQSELAGWLGVRKATVTVALRSLEKRGLIVRERDADDRRVINVSASEKSFELRPKVYEAWRRLDEQTVAGLTEDEMAVLERLLAKVRDSLVRHD